MRSNHLKKILNEGGIMIGTMICDIRSPALIQIMANAGFDFVTFDLEHTGYSMQTVADLIIGARAAGIISLVRVSHRAYEPMISRPLDIGAQGLVIPNVQSSEEARRVVQMAKYYPDGKRGAALKRIHSDFSGISVDRIIHDSNDNLMLIVQIESREAIDDIEEIVSSSGVDGVLIGPNDLSVSLGIPGKSSDPKLRECVTKAVAACRKYNKVAGIVVGSFEAAKQSIEEGIRLLIYSADIYMLLEKATESMNELAKLRSGV